MCLFSGDFADRRTGRMQIAAVHGAFACEPDGSQTKERFFV